jgi:hypothetical protein
MKLLSPTNPLARATLAMLNAQTCALKRLVSSLLFAAALCGLAQAQTAPVVLGTPASVSANVVPGATSVELAIPVSGITRLRLDAIVPVAGALVSLTDPQGRTVVSPGDARVTFNAGQLLRPPLPGGIFELPELTAPADGTWRLLVTFPAAIERTVVMVTVIAASRYQAAVVMDRDTLIVGEDAAIGLAVQDNGAPILGLSPTITVARVGNSGSSTSARDDGVGPDGRAGDGVYSIERTFTEAGEYDIRADVTFSTTGGPVSRTAIRRVRVVTPSVSPPTINLSNQLGNAGCVNGLQVGLNLTALKAGSYTTLVRLTGRNNRSIDVRKAFALGAGSSTNQSAVFSAQSIKQTIGIDGPYNVSLIDILDVGGDEFSLAFRRRDAGSFNLVLANFCNLPIELPGPLTVTPVLKGNFIGSLDLSFPVLVTASGNYQISFKVISANGFDLGLVNATRALSAGLNNVTVRLASDAYLSNDGPYQLISLLVLSGGTSAQQTVVGSSAAYSKWQFAPRITGDLNNDGSVDAADSAILANLRGVPALRPGDRRDINRDGVIDLRDARELQRLVCKAPNCPVNP